MKVCIRRGAKQIGGTCVEIESQGKRLVLDIGTPLDADDPAKVELPAVPGFDKKDPTLLGIILSHPHVDHYGLAFRVPKTTTFLMGEATERILAAAAVFTPSGGTFEHVMHMADRKPIPLGPFVITSFLMDHSAFDSYAVLVEADGNLDEEESYAYFHPRRRSQLLSEKQLLADLTATMQFAVTLPVTGIIAPNIVVPRSFDSAEAAISMDFIRNTREVFAAAGDKRPVYATLAVSHDALIQKEELLRFLNDLTMLDNRPDGFYVLVGVNRDDARTELYHADVVAGWMLINHVLALNGYRVINGYSDILTPFLGAAGGYAGATGWWSNLRAFSMERFAPPGAGGRLPTERYLSCALLNRITYFELEQLRNVVAGVLNRLSTDRLYPDGSSQPPRPQEVMQSWEAISRLNAQLVRGDVGASLNACRAALESAQGLYDRIGMRLPVPLDVKSNDQHIEPLKEGIRLFTALAELDFA